MMIPGLEIRVALFLFLHDIFIMHGYARPPSLVQPLQLPEYKRSSTERFVLDSATNLKLTQTKERDSSITHKLTERKTDRGKLKERHHHNTMLKSKGDFTLSQSEQAIDHFAVLSGRNFKHGKYMGRNMIRGTGVTFRHGRQAFRKHKFHELIRLQNNKMVDDVVRKNDYYRTDHVKFKIRQENAKTRGSNIPLHTIILSTKNDTILSSKRNSTVAIQSVRVSNKFNNTAAIKKAKELVLNATILHRMVRSLHPRWVDQSDSRVKQPFEFRKEGVAEKPIPSLSYEENKLLQSFQNLSKAIFEGRIQSQLCRTLKKLLAHTINVHTSIDTVSIGRQDNQSMSEEQKNKESLALRVLQDTCTSKHLSMEEASKKAAEFIGIISAMLENIVTRLYYATANNTASSILATANNTAASILATATNTAAAILANRNQSLESVINSAVIQISKKLIASVYALHNTLAASFPEIAIEQNRNELFLDGVLASASKEIVAKEVVIKLRFEAKRLKLLFLRLSRLFMERLNELINFHLYGALKKLMIHSLTLYDSLSPGLLCKRDCDSVREQELKNKASTAFQVLKNEQSFKNLSKKEATRRAVNAIRIVSSIVRNIIQKVYKAPLLQEGKGRSALLQKGKGISDAGISQIVLKTLANLRGKVSVLYSTLALYLPKMPDQREVNGSNSLSGVTASDPREIVARKTAEAIRLEARTLHQLMRRIVAKTPKYEKSLAAEALYGDKRALYDGNRIHIIVLKVLRHFLQWALNFSDILLKNLASNETINRDSSIPAVAGIDSVRKETNNVMKETAQDFLDIVPKLSDAFKTVIEKELLREHLDNDTNIRGVTLTTSPRPTRKKKRKYDFHEKKRAITSYILKDNLDKRASNGFDHQLQKVVGYGAECQQRKVATSAEYNVYHIQKGIATKKLAPGDFDSPFGFSIEGLDKVARYKNTDVALEFSFTRPLLVSAIGFTAKSNNESGSSNDGLSVKLATIYVEKHREKNSWSPILNEDTKNVKIFKISSKLLHFLPHLNDTLSGIRLYPQKWYSSPATIGRPIFIYCVSSA